MELIIAMLQVGLFVSIFLGIIWSVLSFVTYFDNNQKNMQRMKNSDDRAEIQKKHMRLMEKARSIHSMQLEFKKLNISTSIESKKLNTSISIESRKSDVLFNMATQVFTSNVDSALSLLGLQDAAILHYRNMDPEQIAMVRVDKIDLMEALKSPTKMALLEQKVIMEKNNHCSLLDEKQNTLDVITKHNHDLIGLAVSSSRKENKKGHCSKCDTLRQVDDNGNCIYCGKRIESTVRI
ncbi:MAG TPA: hypothetical protein VMX17_11660 [Candidatus Glassbacteria bacterium]|nr:hypothetical protein [Candidatus Glassbacteria bacterium]